MCGGGGEGGEGRRGFQDPATLTVVAHGLRVGLQAPPKHVQHLGNVHTRESRSRGRYAFRSSLGKIVELWVISYATTSIVLTSGCAEDLDNVPMKGGEEGGEEGGRSKVLQAPRVGCGLGHKHQDSTCDICVTHVHGGVAPAVVTLFGGACARFRVVSHRPLNDALNRIVLTFKYAENVDYVPVQGGRRSIKWLNRMLMAWKENHFNLLLFRRTSP